jgi:hypothetical protein
MRVVWLVLACLLAGFVAWSVLGEVGGQTSSEAARMAASDVGEDGDAQDADGDADDAVAIELDRRVPLRLVPAASVTPHVGLAPAEAVTSPHERPPRA